MENIMKEGVTVYEPVDDGAEVGAFNTYEIDGGLSSVTDFYHFVHGLRERGFIERHGDYLRWYPPRAILNVTWKIQGDEG